jgi:hypothetical protein
VRRFALAVLGVVIFAGGYGTLRHHTRTTQPPSAAVASKPAAHQCDPRAIAPAGRAGDTLVALARSHVVAYRQVGGQVLRRFGARNVNRAPTVFAIQAMHRSRSCTPAWYRVQIPVRPNGTTAWIPAKSVRVLAINKKIVIHVKAARLELLQGGRVVFRAPIAPGAADTPTPIGHFYVTQRLVPKNPSGPWGPAALGTSAFSSVLTNWVQNGPVGIHGTDEPWVIGHPASHGCIRLLNSAMTRLFRLTPAGTPVLIAP